MQLKKCAGCARAIVESAAGCNYCGHGADAAVAPVPASSRDIHEPGRFDEDLPFDDDLPLLDEALDQSPALTPSAEQPRHTTAVPPAAAVTPVAAKGRRQLATVAGGLFAGVVVIVAVLSARGAASPEASAPAAAPAKPKPAATKPQASPAPAAAAAHVPTVSAPAWNHVTDGRWVGRERRSIALELNAVNKVPIWMREVRPVLVVRCLSNSIDVFVFTQTAAKMEPQDENHSVRVRVDDGQELSERWADSLEHDALFAPDGSALAKQLMSAKTLRFGFTPHNANPVVAQFDVTGLAELLAPSARQCGWKPATPAPTEKTVATGRTRRRQGRT